MLTDPRDGELDPESHCPIHGVRYRVRDNACVDCVAEAATTRELDAAARMAMATAARKASAR